MNYDDFMLSGCFKTTSDGRRAFYPWPLRRRGYIVPSEEEYQRLRKRLTLYLIVAPMILSALLAPLLVVEILTIKQALFTPLLLLAPYYLWVMMYCRRFQRCSERYGYKEAFANQAKATSFAFLWLCTITNFYFFAFWLLTLIRHPSDWRMPLLFTIFFGAAAALTAKSILVKWKIKRGMR